MDEKTFFNLLLKLERRIYGNCHKHIFGLVESRKRETPVNQRRIVVPLCFIVNISKDNKESKRCKSHFPLILFVWKHVEMKYLKGGKERDGGRSVRLNKR